MMSASSLPLWTRKFIVDFIETGLGAVLALDLVFPSSTPQAGQAAHLVGVAVLSALVSAIRRAVPPFRRWLRLKMGTTTDGTPPDQAG
jgi:hypothetical protein